MFSCLLLLVILPACSDDADRDVQRHLKNTIQNFEGQSIVLAPRCPAERAAFGFPRSTAQKS